MRRINLTKQRRLLLSIWQRSPSCIQKFCKHFVSLGMRSRKICSLRWDASMAVYHELYFKNDISNSTQNRTCTSLWWVLWDECLRILVYIRSWREKCNDCLRRPISHPLQTKMQRGSSISNSCTSWEIIRISNWCEWDISCAYFSIPKRVNWLCACPKTWNSCHAKGVNDHHSTFATNLFHFPSFREVEICSNRQVRSRARRCVAVNSFQQVKKSLTIHTHTYNLRAIILT